MRGRIAPYSNRVERKGWMQMPVDCRSDRKMLICACVEGNSFKMFSLFFWNGR